VIHWREQQDGYVVSVSRRERAAGWALFGAAPAAGLVWLARELPAGMLETVPFAPAIMTTIAATIFLGFLVRGSLDLPRRSWIEVSLKGKTARWGERGGVPMADFVEVERFESAVLLGAWNHHIVAVLPDGRRMPVLESWSAPPIQTRVVADRLNDLLGAERPPA